MTLLVATPVRGAELWSAPVSVGYCQSLCTLAVDLALPMHRRWVYGLDVVRARNRMVAEVLSDPVLADVTHVLWWDDDNWPEDARVVPEMMALGLDVVAAPYTNKRQPMRWVHQSWGDGRVPDERGLLDVRGVGMGFTLTSRRCLEVLAVDARRYWDAPNPRECPDVFGQLYDDFAGRSVLLSEDYSFCKRWRERGGLVYVYGRAGLVFHAGAHAWSAKDMKGGTIE
jgi:hypothetical protein